MTHRALPLGLLAFSCASVFAFACDSANVGAPCEVDADCEGELICDVHDGQGTCQEDHGHDEHGDEHDSHEHDSHDHGDEHGDEHGDSHGEEVDCDAETRGDAFMVGLSKTGAELSATFVSAMPAPPAMGENSWVLSWTDGEGQPLDGLDISVTPWMPDHDHGTPIEVTVTPTGTAGEYLVEPVDLFMAGYWDIGFEVANGDQSDSLSFGFCVQ